MYRHAHALMHRHAHALMHRHAHALMHLQAHALMHRQGRGSASGLWCHAPQVGWLLGCLARWLEPVPVWCHAGWLE